MKSVNFAEKFGLFDDQWSPRVIAEMNDYQFKLVRIEGEFVWHRHEDTDETFIVIEGAFDMHYRNRVVPLQAGEMCVVPKGVEHKPVAATEAKVLIIEPRGVVNTGDATNSEKTAENDVWL